MSRLMTGAIVLFVVVSLSLLGCSFGLPDNGQNATEGHTVEVTSEGADSGVSGENVQEGSGEAESGAKYTVSRVMQAVVLESDMKAFVDAVVSAVGDNEVVALGFDAKRAPFYAFTMTMVGDLDENVFKDIVENVKKVAPPDKVFSQYSGDYGYITVASDSEYNLSFNLSYDGEGHGITVGVSKIAKDGGVDAFGLDLPLLGGKWRDVDSILGFAGVDTPSAISGEDSGSLYLEFPANGGGVRITYASFLPQAVAEDAMEKLHSALGGDVMDIGGGVKTLDAQYKGINVNATVVKAKGDMFNLVVTLEF